jgi:hypothetical protein
VGTNQNDRQQYLREHSSTNRKIYQTFSASLKPRDIYKFDFFWNFSLFLKIQSNLGDRQIKAVGQTHTPVSCTTRTTCRECCLSFSFPISTTAITILHKLKATMNFQLKKREEKQVIKPVAGFAGLDDENIGSRNNNKGKGRETEVLEIVSGEGIIHSDGSHIPKKPLVIPLIKANEWRNTGNIPQLSSTSATTASSAGEATTAEQNAASGLPPNASAILFNNQASAPSSNTTAAPSDSQEPIPMADIQPFSSSSSSSSEPASSINTDDDLKNGTSVTGGSKRKWGLQIRKPKQQPLSPAPSSESTNTAPTTSIPAQPQTIEEEAIESLVNGRRPYNLTFIAAFFAIDTNYKQPTQIPLTEARSGRAVPILQQNAVPGLENLDDAKDKYKHDVSLRPDENTLDDYEEVPVEEFGAAMMRGMGWKDTDLSGGDSFVFHKPRPNLLGLGAAPPPPPPNKKQKKESSSSSVSSSAKDKPHSNNSNSKYAGSSSSSANGNSVSPSSSSSRPRASSSSKLSEGSRVRIRKDGKHYKRIGIVLSLRDKGRDGIAVKVELDDGEVGTYFELHVDLVF